MSINYYGVQDWVYLTRHYRSVIVGFLLNVKPQIQALFGAYGVSQSSILEFGAPQGNEYVAMASTEYALPVRYSLSDEGYVQRLTYPQILSDAKFIVKSHSGEAYRYFDVGHANIDDADVENVKIKFRVRKSWLDDNDVDKSTVSLNRYHENNWEKLETTIVSEDSGYVHYEAVPPGFSLFVITGMETSLVCNNNGICGTGENAENCPNDCHCLPGETRSCAIAHYGVCSSGVETCTNSRWTGCPSPQTETCNRRDDDCDGTVDDVNNGNSVSSTGCHCYNNALPKGEECNGIDDDCNGVKDENLERTCGPDNIKGICRQGISTCTNGQWSDCIGMVYPQQNELCGNNLDENCNGMVDDGCETCYNGEQDGDEEGVDCGGSCQPCPMGLLWLAFIVIGVVVLLVILILFFAGSGKEEKEWDELVRKEMNREESI
jgi:PGF-pre-PGF domain-containing protein